MKTKKLRAKLLSSVISCFFLVVVLTPPYSSAKEKKEGARLVLERKDGRIVEGELLSVKESTLILLDHVQVTKLAEDIEDLRTIRIAKKSKALKGIGRGFLIGAASGALVGVLSGDDKSGWIRFSAGQKALGGALSFGIVGILIGGIFGAIAGIDETILLSERPPEEIKKVLAKLSAKARYLSGIPENIDSLEKRKTEEKPRVEAEILRKPAAEKLRKFHFSLTPGYFNSRGTESFKNMLVDLGFDEDKKSGSFFGPIEIEYPWVKTHPVLFIKEVRLDYSVTSKIAVGLMYSPLGSHNVRGRAVVFAPDWRWPDYKPESYLNVRYKGNAFFLTASYFPLPDAFLKKTTLKLGGGLGFGKISGAFLTSLYGMPSESQEKDPYSRIDRADFDLWSPGFVAFYEFHYFFSRNWSLGANLDYKYILCRTESFQLEAPYSYAPAPNTPMDESFSVRGSAKRFNAGGIGLGLSFGFHF